MHALGARDREAAARAERVLPAPVLRHVRPERAHAAERGRARGRGRGRVRHRLSAPRCARGRSRRRASRSARSSRPPRSEKILRRNARALLRARVTRAGQGLHCIERAWDKRSRCTRLRTRTRDREVVAMRRLRSARRRPAPRTRVDQHRDHSRRLALDELTKMGWLREQRARRSPMRRRRSAKIRHCRRTRAARAGDPHRQPTSGASVSLRPRRRSAARARRAACSGRESGPALLLELLEVEQRVVRALADAHAARRA